MPHPIVVLVFAALFGLPACVGGKPEPFAVAAYLPEWRYGGTDWDAVMPHLTHLILFSIEVAPTGELTALDRLLPAAHLAAARAAAALHGTKLMQCIGGNARSDGFPAAVGDPASRARFVAALVALCEDSGLHGIDLNWEYPRTWEEWHGLFDLIRELRAALPAGAPLSMAVYPGQERLLPAAVVQHLDFVHQMTYDNVCSHPRTSPPCRHSTYEFAVQSIDGARGTGVPLSKLTLGLPFYARHMWNGDWETYANIVERVAPGISAEEDEISNLYFNGKATIQRKVLLAQEVGLAGVMIWELGQDTHPSSPLSLLSTISVTRQEFVSDEL